MISRTQPTPENAQSATKPWKVKLAVAAATLCIGSSSAEIAHANEPAAGSADPATAQTTAEVTVARQQPGHPEEFPPDSLLVGLAGSLLIAAVALGRSGPRY